MYIAITYLGTPLATDNKTIQSYNESAEEWAARLRSGNNPAHRFLEKPAMFAKLPDIKGLRVLCVGCGTGEECHALTSLGATVVGIDISSGLIKEARKAYPDIKFLVMDVELLLFDNASFDFVYSSLTLHYLEDWITALSEIKRIMVPGGHFLFSTHHPVKWGSQVTREESEDIFIMGYERPKDGSAPQVYGDYLTPRKLEDTWFGSFTVTFFHRPLSHILRDILGSGMVIDDFIEPLPSDESKTEAEAFWTIHRAIPLFMIFDLRKPFGFPD